MKKLKTKVIIVAASLVLVLGILYLPAINTAKAQVDPAGDDLTLVQVNGEYDCVEPDFNCTESEICADPETGERVPCEN